VLRVAWREAHSPEAGAEYLYLDEPDYLRLSAAAPAGQPAIVRAEVRPGMTAHPPLSGYWRSRLHVCVRFQRGAQLSGMSRVVWGEVCSGSPA
jgi:hypothetical protein